MIGEIVRSQRSIADASEIPRTDRWNRIGLVRTSGEDPKALVQAGAKEGAAGWTIPRSASVSLDRLSGFLPRIAQKSILPRVVDLIPSSAWHASLANMLVGSSWKVVRDITTMRAVSCEDCGSQFALECHERWSYDDVARVQQLVGFEALCGACHETRHLGFASVRGRYAEACSRLAAVERLRPAEMKPFCDEVFRRFEARSAVTWSLGLEILKGHSLKLKRDLDLTREGKLIGRVGAREVVVQTRGVEIIRSGKALVIA